MLEIKQFHLYLADLSPRFGTEPGKTRPVVVVQTDLLNDVGHPSTLVCPISTQIHEKASLLRVHLDPDRVQINKKSDILVDQIRAIDNKRFVSYLGVLDSDSKDKLIQNLAIVLRPRLEF
ncbi:MAG: type II toxin-antitoxin system PemK/MazF family toxin [Candidatus Margulisiibacteriota bacterium]